MGRILGFYSTNCPCSLVTDMNDQAFPRGLISSLRVYSLIDVVSHYH